VVGVLYSLSQPFDKVLQSSFGSLKTIKQGALLVTRYQTNKMGIRKFIHDLSQEWFFLLLTQQLQLQYVSWLFNLLSILNCCPQAVFPPPPNVFSKWGAVWCLCLQNWRGTVCLFRVIVQPGSSRDTCSRLKVGVLAKFNGQRSDRVSGVYGD